VACGIRVSGYERAGAPGREVAAAWVSGPGG
jgi:hypothetical protein